MTPHSEGPRWLIRTKGSRGLSSKAAGIHDRVSFRAIVAAPAIRVLIVVLLYHYLSYSLFTSEFSVFLADRFMWNGHAFCPKELSYILGADGVINFGVQLFLLEVGQQCLH
ncbi:hypothetical protein ACSV5G_21440 [Agrobacterium cavarae]|uniref:hypothetical protein n=1 Tax=Agrobacterium cavarae TaxID=2528239 RepID=UPI003FD5FBE9